MSSVIKLSFGIKMSISKTLEEKTRAEEFERLIERETKYVEDLMKKPSETMKTSTIGMMTSEQATQTGIALIKKSGFLLLKFNNLSGNFKISLFDKLMNYVEKLKGLLEEYGKKIGVGSFSITVGVPFGVSISFTFEIK